MNIQKFILHILAVFIFGSATLLNVFAATLSITDIISPIDSNTSHDFSSVRPSSVYIFPLTADMFTWSGSPSNTGDPVTRSQLRSANISVKYSTSQSRVIKDVTLSTTTYNGMETACIKLEFAEDFASVKSLDFRLTIYLTMGNTRKDASSVTVNGTFENEEIEIDSGYDHISLADGQVLSSSDYISELEIDLGDSVQIFARIQRDKKYYAKAKDEILDKDDAMIKKYPDIEKAIRIYSVNLSPTGNCVSLSDVGSYHVYTSTGKYLGTTDKRLPFYDLYYLTNNKISMSGSSSNADTSGGSKDSGSSVGIVSGNTPEEKAAKEDMASAAGEALASGSSSARVYVKDMEKISAGELQSMFDAASLSQLKAEFVADTMTASGRGVQGRITINPALAVKLNEDIMLGVYTSNSTTSAIKKVFNSRYSNNLKVVYLAQKGSYRMKVRIAAKVDTSDMKKSNLYFYSYDKAKNSVQQIVKPNYYVDKNGFLHFDTVYGGYIIVSDGVLTKKK